MPDTYNPTVIKGDTIIWAMNVTGATGASYDITGCTLAMQVRKSYHPSGLIVSYNLYVSEGLPVVPVDGVVGGLAASATGGIVYVTVGSQYTKNFSEYAPSFYDMQLIYPNEGGVTTLLRGRIETLPDVTEN